jgi:hypothetical protein
LTVLVALLAIAVGGLTVLVFGLLRTHAEILRTLDRAGLGLDAAGAGRVGPVPVAPPTSVGAARDVAGTIPGGGAVKIGVAGVDHPTLLAFLSSGCLTCKSFWEAFADPDLELPGVDTRLVIVGQDPIHDSESGLAALAPPGVRVVCSTEAWQTYEVPGSPYFILVDGSTSQIIGAGSASSWEQIRGLLDQAIGDAGLARSRRSADTRPVVDLRPSVDEALRVAGIDPGHPSLYPKQLDDDENESRSWPSS